MGPMGKMMPTYRATNALLTISGRFDRVLPARSWEMTVERELPAKIGRCYKKPFGHNFRISALTLNQQYFIYIKIPLIQWLGSILKIVAKRFWETPHKVIFFSHEMRVNFGRP